VLTGIVVAPITRTVRAIASEMPLGPEEGLSEESVANCDSLLTLPKDRFDREPIGALGPAKVPRLDAAVRFALGIIY
jgi:mRNA interferase MazF